MLKNCEYIIRRRFNCLRIVLLLRCRFEVLQPRPQGHLRESPGDEVGSVVYLINAIIRYHTHFLLTTINPEDPF